MKKRVSVIFAILVFVFCIAGCQSGTEADTPVATDAPEKEVTVTPEPTATPEATATPEPTATPKPTATPEPIVNDKVKKELIGYKWVLTQKARDNYGRPRAILFDEITEETATVTYVIDESTIYRSECIGIQEADGEYFLKLECDVAYKDGKLVITSKKQNRDFNSLTKNQETLCTIKINPKAVHNMKCEFYTWEYDLERKEEQAPLTHGFRGTIVNDIRSLAIFQEMCAAVTSDHKLYLWGYKALNYVCDNPVKGTAIEPTFVMDGVTKVINAGSMDGFIIKDDKTLWGFDYYSRFGKYDDDTGNEKYARKIADGVKDAAGNTSVAVVLYEDGTLEALQASTYCKKNQIENISDVVEIGVGGEYVMALKADGTLWGLGRNSNYVLGLDKKDAIQSEYVQIMSDVVSIETGHNRVFAIKSDGSLWAWGNNDYGDLGTWDFYTRTKPVKVMEHVAEVCAGGSTYIITTDGVLYVSGSERNYPVKLESGVVAVKADSGVLMVVKENGDLYTMGMNNNHQLGYQTDGNKTEKFRKCMGNILVTEE